MARTEITGNGFRDLIAAYIHHQYGDQGLVVYREVNLGKTIIAKDRQIDVFVMRPVDQKAIAIECKYQDVSGTADEKIPYTLQDLAALRMPAAVAYAGAGFSEGVLHLLQASELAAYCLPDDSLKPLGRKVGESIDCGTWQLDHILAMTFGWWDIFVAGRTPLDG